MNKQMIRYVCAWVLMVVSFLMLIPIIVAFVYAEEAYKAFIITIAINIGVALMLGIQPPKNYKFYAKEGLITVAFSWIIISVFGSLPFLISGSISSFTDAIFETVSGFTTTGSSILTSVEDLPKAILFWRSFTHWIGGMGILVFMMAVIPKMGEGNNMLLMKNESPGPQVGKLVPKISDTAKYLYIIYTLMTIVFIIILILIKMPIFDALTLGLGTAGTGGFAVRNDGCSSYTSLQLIALSIGMLAFGVNFQVYFLLVIKKYKQAFQCEELKWYLIIVTLAVGFITINLTCTNDLSIFINLRDALFQVSSIITTTGFANVDFNFWPTFSRTILIILMFTGACAGSTAGGIKVSRIVMYAKIAKKEIFRYMHPRIVKHIKFENKIISNDVLRSLGAYLALYGFIFFISLLIVTLDNFDFETSFSAVAATLNNIGPGLSTVGPMANFSELSNLSKWVLIFDMLLGRLELFPLLVIFTSNIWKKS